MNRRLIACSLGFPTLLSAGCTTRHAAAQGGEPPKAVRLITVQYANDAEPKKYSAIIAPDAQVELSFRVSGYVVDLKRGKSSDGRVRALEPGDVITAGTVLGRLRHTEFQATVDKAGSERDEAQAALTQAELDYGRVSKLWEQESITKPAYDGSRARLDMARAKLDEATAQLREAQVALDDTELRAPFDGVLLDRKVELGTLVAAGVPAFTVADLRMVKGRFNVPDSALGDFRVGQDLEISVDAFPGRSFKSRVISRAASADPRVLSFQIEVSIANPGLKLRSGMIAAVELVRTPEQTRRLQVPVDALVYDAVRDRYLVYGIEQRTGSTYAREILVRPGPLSGSSILILNGLNAGQRVVASGANLLRSGDPIRGIE